MSKPVFDGLFELNGRRDRLSYYLLHFRIVCAWVLVMVLLFIVSMSWLHLDSFAVVALLILPFLFTCLISMIASAQRFRDFGWSGSWALLLLIPYVGLAVMLLIFFVPGDEGENKFGPNPMSGECSVAASE